MPIVTNFNIQEFKETQTMYWVYDDVNMLSHHRRNLNLREERIYKLD
jgi:hypothetical protein